jgi:hypothetical protein
MCCEDHPLSYPNMALCNPFFYHLSFLHGTFYSLPYAYYSEKLGSSANVLGNSMLLFGT